MRIIVLAAGWIAIDARRPTRLLADIHTVDAVHTVELDYGSWRCTCGGGCDHIAAVKPLAGQETAAPVADGPVTLDVEEAIDVLDHQGIEGGFNGWTVVADDEVDHGRWESHHRLVIRNERGEHFAANYRQGLTEHQDTGPWEDEETVTFHPVAPRTRLARVTEWGTPEQSGGAQ
jgi:hypothetical protein